MAASSTRREFLKTASAGAAGAAAADEDVADHQQQQDRRQQRHFDQSCATLVSRVSAHLSHPNSLSTAGVSRVTPLQSIVGRGIESDGPLAMRSSQPFARRTRQQTVVEDQWAWRPVALRRRGSVMCASCRVTNAASGGAPSRDSRERRARPAPVSWGRVHPPSTLRARYVSRPPGVAPTSGEGPGAPAVRRPSSKRGRSA